MAVIDGTKRYVSDCRVEANDEDTQAVKVIQALVDNWQRESAAASRTDVGWRDIGFDDHGIDGFDRYVLIRCTDDDFSEDRVKSGAMAVFFNGEPTPAHAGLSSVSVLYR